MREGIVILLERTHHESEARTKVFLLVLALIGDMWRVIYHNIKTRVLERHRSVVGYQAWAVTQFEVQANNAAFAPLPKSPTINCCVKYSARPLPRVKFKKPFQQLRIVAVPDGRQGCISRIRLCLQPLRARNWLNCRCHCGKDPLYTVLAHSRNCESFAKEMPDMDRILPLCRPIG